MPVRPVRGKTVIVTGATSGIGLETARAFLRAGANVVAAGRRQERLDAFVNEAKGGPALGIRTDVADYGQVEALVAAARERFGSVDVLVNNAGSGISARFMDMALEDFRRLMEVNFWGAVHGCRAVVPVMQGQAAGGVVINVSSILGKRGAPFETAYCSTKFALAGFSEALRTELLGERIDVSTIFPGLVESEFVEASQVEGGVLDPAVAAAVPKLPARELARAIVQDARFPQPEIVMALDAQFLNAMNTLAPWALDWAMGVGAQLAPRRP
jgi:NAD(P)-dependent dehydrogenase (short-subunit alcohol dehydrogenase family)